MSRRGTAVFDRGKRERDEAFSAFVVQATPSLMRTGLLLTGSPDQAHELVQAALVKTYVAWPRIRSGEATAYARRVLVNHRTDSWRRTRGEVSVPAPPELPTTPGTVTEDRDQVLRLLATLPPQQRRVVVLRHYHDQSEQAVAETLGISVGAVKSAASRGLAALRQAYADAESASPDPSPARTNEEATR